MQGGSLCPFSVIACYPADKCWQNSRAHHSQTGTGILMCSSGTVAPPLEPLSGLGNHKSVTSQEGTHQRDEKWALLTQYLWQGVWGRDATSCEMGASVPHPILEG